MTFMGVVRNPQHPSYVKQEGDLAVGGKILVEDLTTGESDVVEPIYLIRDSRPMILKDNSTKLGAHVRFSSINPATETFDLQIAQEEKKNNGIPLEISTKSFRTDYIVLETIIFPGINLVWLGSLMMMIGLLVGMFYRRAQRVDG
jgi:cytochrome c-type biogenesis protein CcmF